jgi:hypothetical protein
MPYVCWPSVQHPRFFNQTSHKNELTQTFNTLWFSSVLGSRLPLTLTVRYGIWTPVMDPLLKSESWLITSSLNLIVQLHLNQKTSNTNQHSLAIWPFYICQSQQQQQPRTCSSKTSIITLTLPKRSTTPMLPPPVWKYCTFPCYILLVINKILLWNVEK